MASIVDTMMRPFQSQFSEHDVIANMGGNSSYSPAVAAVKRLRRNVTPHNKQKSIKQVEKDASALASIAFLQNPDIVHDVAGRKEMRDSIQKPTKYVDGVHINEIRQQAMLLKQFESHKSKQIVSDGPGFFTPPPNKPTHQKVMARSYRNNLDSKYTRELVTPEDEKKPNYDWVKQIRKQILMKMKSNSDVEAKRNLVKLSKILTHQHPQETFIDLKNVYEDGEEIKMDQSDIIEAMLCYI